MAWPRRWDSWSARIPAWRWPFRVSVIGFHGWSSASASSRNRAQASAALRESQMPSIGIAAMLPVLARHFRARPRRSLPITIAAGRGSQRPGRGDRRPGSAAMMRKSRSRSHGLAAWRPIAATGTVSAAPMLALREGQTDGFRRRGTIHGAIRHSGKTRPSASHRHHHKKMTGGHKTPLSETDLRHWRCWQHCRAKNHYLQGI